MAFRRKRPQLNLDFVVNSSGPKSTGRSDESTPGSSNHALLAEGLLPPSRYNLPSAGSSNPPSSSSSFNVGADAARGVGDRTRTTSSGDVISDSTYRSPGLGLSIGKDYVRIHTNSEDHRTGEPRRHDDLEETLQIKSAQPWSTHLFNMSALGRGQCSTVYKAVLLRNPAPPPGRKVKLPPKPWRLYAVKSVQSYDVDKSQQLLREISLLSTLSCRALVQFEGAFFARSEVSIVLEFMDRGSLESLVKDCSGRGGGKEFVLPRPALAGIMYQLLFGLSYLHWYKMSHRDIKPANVLINSAGEVKISDFGIASGRSLSATAGRSSLSMSNESTLGKGMNSTHVGTSMYMSPERLRGGKYDISGDVWSLGLVFFECGLGFNPFRNMSEVEIVVTIDDWDGMVSGLVGDGRLQREVEGKDRGWLEMVGLCLLKDPKRRIRSDILLKSPWLGEHCRGDLDTSVLNVRSFLGSSLGPQDDENLSSTMVDSMVRSSGGVPREYKDMYRSFKRGEGKEGWGEGKEEEEEEEGKEERKQEGKWGEDSMGMDVSVDNLSSAIRMSMSIGGDSGDYSRR